MRVEMEVAGWCRCGWLIEYVLAFLLGGMGW